MTADHSAGRDRPRIKAIETSYAGYRFRSRLEARWAVFFDALDVRWLYEPEGFDCGGFWYLPDFYLPDWDIYFEVRPDLPNDFGDGFVLTHDGDGFTATGKFIAASSGFQSASTDERGRQCVTHRLYMLCGTPGVPVMKMTAGVWKLMDGAVAVSTSQFPGGVVALGVSAFANTEGGKKLDVWPLYGSKTEATGFRSPVASRGHTITTVPPLLVSPSLPGESILKLYVGAGVDYNSTNLINAYRAARSARFEHGESPRH